MYHQAKILAPQYSITSSQPESTPLESSTHKTLWCKCIAAMGVLCVALWASMLAGCGDSSGTRTQEYSLQSLDSTYTITLQNDNKLIAKANGSTIDSALLLVFIEPNCPMCQAYYEHLNHLQANEKNLTILGIIEPDKQANIQEILQQLNDTQAINFTLLANTSKNSLLQTLLAQKDARAKELYKTQDEAQNIESNEPESTNPDSTKDAISKDTNPANTTQIAESSTESNVKDSQTTQEASQNNEQNSNQAQANQESDKTNDEKTSQTTSKLDSAALPYFVLYDTEQQFYQDYEGIVPEEIFSSDIAQITH